MKEKSPLKHDQKSKSGVSVMHTHNDPVESYNPNSGVYTINDVVQDEAPEWLVTYDDINNLKTPSHNKVDKKDIERIYHSLSSKGHDIETIRKVINGVKKKRYNSYVSNVEKYNTTLAGYGASEEKLLNLAYDKEIERHDEYGSNKPNESQKKAIKEEMKKSRVETGKFGTYEVTYEDKDGNTIEQGDTSSYENILKTSHVWVDNDSVHDGKKSDLSDQILDYQNDDFVAGTLTRAYSRFGFTFKDTGNDMITATNSITGESYEFETNFVGGGGEYEKASGEGLVDWMNGQPQKTQGTAKIQSTGEFEKRQKIDQKIATLETLEDIDYNFLMNNEEERAVEYINERFEKNINKNLTQDGVVFSAEETGMFNIDAANIYKTVNGGEKQFVQRIAFDHENKEQAVRELGYLESNIKKEVARSLREEIVVQRDEEDIRQIETDNFLLDKNTGIAYSQHDVVEMFEKQGGNIEFVTGAKNLTAESRLAFSSFVDDFVGYDGEAKGIMNQLQIARKGEMFAGGDPVRQQIEDLIVNGSSGIRIDDMNEKQLQKKLFDIFGIQGLQVAWMNDKLEIRIGDEMFTLDGGSIDDSEIINTTYEILTAYKNLSTEEIEKSVIGGVLDDEGRVYSEDEWTGGDLIIDFGNTYSEKLKNKGLSNVRCIEYDGNDFKTIQYDYNGETHTVDISGKVSGSEGGFLKSTKRSLRPGFVLEEILVDLNLNYSNRGEKIRNEVVDESLNFKESKLEKYKIEAENEIAKEDNITALINGSFTFGDARESEFFVPYQTFEEKGSHALDLIPGTNMTFGNIVSQVMKNGGGSSNISQIIDDYFGILGDMHFGYAEEHDKNQTNKYRNFHKQKDGWQESRKDRAENFNVEDFLEFANSTISYGAQLDRVIEYNVKEENNFSGTIQKEDLESLALALDAIHGKGDGEDGYSKTWEKIRHEVTNQRENVVMDKLFQQYSADNPGMAPILTMGTALGVEGNTEKVNKLIRKNFETDVYLRKTFNENKVRLQAIANEVNEKGAYVDPETFLLQNTDELTPLRVKEINKKLQNIKSTQEKTIADVTASYGDVNTLMGEAQRSKEDDEIISTAAQKKYGGMNSFAVSAEASFEQLALAVPMLFQDDAAIGAFASLQEAQQLVLPTPVAWNEEKNARQYREFIGRTIGEQAANTTLAFATAGVGSYFSIGAKTLTTAQAALFGVQSAGLDMGATTSADWRAEIAKNQKGDLREMYEKGYISKRDFQQRSEALDEIITENDSNLFTRYLSAGTKGIVEGMVMKYVGTAINANAMLGVTDDAAKAILNNTTNEITRRTTSGLANTFYKYGGGKVLDFGKTFVKQQLGEVVEEVAAEAGQGLVDALVMDTYRAGGMFNDSKELNWSDHKGIETLKETFMSLDDIAISALVNGGGMSSAGLVFQAPAAYSNIRSIMQNGIYYGMVTDHYTGAKKGTPARNKLFQDIADNINEEQRLKKKLASMSVDDSNYQNVADELQATRETMALQNEGLAIDFASLSKKKQAQLYANSLQLNSIENEAGVKPGMSPEQKQKKVESYAKTLDKAKGKAILEAYDTAKESTVKIVGDISYDKDSAYDLFGDAGKAMQNKFESDKRYKKYKKGSQRDKLAMISRAIKADMVSRGVDVYKNRLGDQKFQQQFEQGVYSIDNWNYDKTKPTYYVDENGQKQLNQPRIPVTFEQYQKVTGKKNRNLKAEQRFKEQLGISGIKIKNETSTLYNQGKELQANVLEMAGPLDQVQALDQGQKKYKDDKGGYIINPDTGKRYTEQEVYLETRDKLREQLQDAFKYKNPNFNPDEDVSENNADYYYNTEEINRYMAMFDRGEIKGAFVQSADGKKYIVQDEVAANEAIRRGDLLQGTMMHHEIGHATDLLALQGDTLQETKENIQTYSDNLAEYASKNLKDIHEQAIQRLRENNRYVGETIDNFNSMDDYTSLRQKQLSDPRLEYNQEQINEIINEEIYVIKNEYTRYLGELITQEAVKSEVNQSEEVRKVMNVKRSVIDRILQRDSNFFPDTPKKAIQYAVSYIKGTQEGNVGKIAGKLVVGKKFQTEGGVNTLLSRVSKQSTDLLTKEKREKLVKEVNESYDKLKEAEKQLVGEKDELVINVLQDQMKDARNDIIENYREMAEKRYLANIATGREQGINVDNLLDDDTKQLIITGMLYDPGTKEIDEKTGKEVGAKSRSVLGMIEDFEKEKHKYGNLAAYINGLFKRRSFAVFAKYNTEFTQQLDFATGELSAVDEDFDANTELNMISKGTIVLNEAVAENDPNEAVGIKARQHTDNVQRIIAENPSEFEGKTFKEMKDLDPQSTVEMMVGGMLLEDGTIQYPVFVDDGSPVWGKPAMKKLLGTSIVDSIVNKLKNNANLNSQEIRALQGFIRRHSTINPAASNLLWKAFPQGYELDVVTTKEGGLKARPGKSTGLNTVLLAKGYNRSSKKIGNGYPQYKKPTTGAGSVSEVEFQGWFGINPRGEADFLGREVNVSDTLKAFVRIYGGITTKQDAKIWFGENGTDLTKERLRFENGMSNILFSKVTADNLNEFPNLREANANFLGLIDLYYGFDTYVPTMKYSDRKKVSDLYKIDRGLVVALMDIAGIPPRLHGSYYNELYGETGQIKAISMIKRNRDGIKTKALKTTPGLIETMDGRVDDAIIDSELQSTLGSDQSIAETYNDPDTVNIARDNIKKEVLVKMVELGIEPNSKGWDKASLAQKTELIQFILDNVGSYARASQIGNRSISIHKEGGKAFKIEAFEEIDLSDNRKQVTEGVGDYAALINQVIPGVTILPTRSGAARGDGATRVKGERTFNGITRTRTEIKMSGEGGLNKMYPGLAKKYSEKTEAVKKELTRKNGKIELTTARPRKNQALRFRGVYKTRFGNMLTRLIDSEDTFGIYDAQMFFGTESSGMEAVGRRSAYLYGITADIFTAKNLGKDMEYDHAKPNNTLMLKSAGLVKAVQEGKMTAQEALAELDVFFEDYHVNAIPKTMDQAIKTAGYQSLLTGKYNPGSPVQGLGWASRIFNDIVKYDPRLRPIIVVDPDFQGNVIGNESVRPEHRISATNETLVTQVENFVTPEMSVMQHENHKIINTSVFLSKAINHKTPSRGMSAFDFDETVGISDNYVIAEKDGETKRIASDEWPFVGEQMKSEGWEMDFTDFNKVTKGRPGPLMEKLRNRIEKFGPENNYILTARAPESETSIHAYLKSEGVDIPLENITGLGNSTGEAKAMWIAQKYSEGYNDMYFVDDALPNVEAVKNMMNELDIKGSSVQAKIQFSKSINPTINNILDSNIKTELDINRILEQTTGVKAEAVFSDAQGKIRGSKKGKWKFWVPPSAEDFKGLIYRFVGKGRQGEAQMAFFKKALFDPFARAYEGMNMSKQQLNNQYRTLLKEFPGVKGILKEKIHGDFTTEQAIRVYLWNKNGMEVPGLSQRDLKALVEAVEGNVETKTFADNLGLITNQEQGYVTPSEYWLVEGILSDIQTINNEISRADHLSEWRQNKEEMFGVWGNDGRLVGDNINKIEAIYGSNFREALEDILWRMEFGSKREAGTNRLVNAFNNWANQSVGAIMFFNMRSALLQTISSINYLNWSDNNPLKAGLALANFPQFLKDFTMIFNSDMLKQRRAGNQRGINEAELAQAVAGSKNKPKAILNWLLTKGFLPTQIADSFAIASGGATFYRNRVNSLLKQGMTQEQAESRAWSDFQENTEESQQSSRPDMISQQQASPLGRYLLAFKNTPMQYARLMKKAFLDLKHGRGDVKTNIGKIIYYGMIQNLIFSALQSALGAMIGGDEDEEKETKAYERTANSMIDSILGGLGIGGNIVSTIKNTILEYNKQEKKGWNADHTYTILKFFGLSPTVGSKGRKLYSAIQTKKYNEDVMKEMSLLDIDNPRWSVIANIVSATTNLPLDRLVKKVDNIDAALTEDITAMQRLALLMGWNTWDLGVDDSDVLAVEDEIKEKKEVEKKEKKKIKKEEKKKEKEIENKAKEEENKKKKDGGCIAISKSGARCKNEAEVNGYCTIHAKVEQGTKEVRCKKIKSDKKRCGMMTKAKSGYCYYHD